MKKIEKRTYYRFPAADEVACFTEVKRRLLPYYPESKSLTSCQSAADELASVVSSTDQILGKNYFYGILHTCSLGLLVTSLFAFGEIIAFWLIGKRKLHSYDLEKEVGGGVLSERGVLGKVKKVSRG